MKKGAKLGQHFLTSHKALRTIVGAADIAPDEIIVEIGPGKGVLTQALLTAGARVHAVEKDSVLVAGLREKFSDDIANGKLLLIEGDILETTISDVVGEKSTGYKVVGNIPYYITGAIIKKFLSEKPHPSVMVLTVQKEVAERIIARDGKESVLSASVKAYGQPRYVQTVPAGGFSPPPKVDSAIIAIENISDDFFNDIDEKKFFEILKTGFAHPRKFVAGNLRSYGESVKETLGERGLSKARPENLSLSDWKALALALS